VALAAELQHLDRGWEVLGRIIHYASELPQKFIIHRGVSAISGSTMDDAMACGDKPYVRH
jgi:hypothetical protein